MNATALRWGSSAHPPHVPVRQLPRSVGNVLATVGLPSGASDSQLIIVTGAAARLRGGARDGTDITALTRFSGEPLRRR